jgi:hypothetical protein
VTAQELAAFQRMGEHLAVLVVHATTTNALLTEILEELQADDGEELQADEKPGELGELAELGEALGVDASALASLAGGGKPGGIGSFLKIAKLLGARKKRAESPPPPTD